MKIFSHCQHFEHQWDSVTLAVFQKYPNPYATHVLSTDIISRHLDSSGRLHSTRLLLKNGGTGVPSWLAALIKTREAYVVEESMVDPFRGVMETSTRNLSHCRLMSIEEIQKFNRHSDNLSTLIETEARFHCGLGRWTGLPSRLEGLGVSKFREHLNKSREALKYVVERIRIGQRERY